MAKVILLRFNWSYYIVFFNSFKRSTRRRQNIIITLSRRLSSTQYWNVSRKTIPKIMSIFINTKKHIQFREQRLLADFEIDKASKKKPQTRRECELNTAITIVIYVFYSNEKPSLQRECNVNAIHASNEKWGDIAKLVEMRYHLSHCYRKLKILI